MRPVTIAEPLPEVLTVGLMTKPPMFSLNVSRSDGLTIRLLPTTAYFAEVMVTIDRRQHQFFLLHQTALEQMVEETLRLLHSVYNPTELPILTTTKRETVKKCVTLMAKEREAGNKTPDPMIETEVIRSLTLQIATGFGAPPGYMSLRNRVYHKDDPYYDGTSSVMMPRDQLLKLFTAIEDHLFLL